MADVLETQERFPVHRPPHVTLGLLVGDAHPASPGIIDLLPCPASTGGKSCRHEVQCLPPSKSHPRQIDFLATGNRVVWPEYKGCANLCGVFLTYPGIGTRIA